VAHCRTFSESCGSSNDSEVHTAMSGATHNATVAARESMSGKQAGKRNEICSVENRLFFQLSPAA
jgi:hypothetical protein